jgi:hypothetical protein
VLPAVQANAVALLADFPGQVGPALHPFPQHKEGGWYLKLLQNP